MAPTPTTNARTWTRAGMAFVGVKMVFKMVMKAGSIVVDRVRRVSSRLIYLLTPEIVGQHRSCGDDSQACPKTHR